jgi:hypothetical protein
MDLEVSGRDLIEAMSRNLIRERLQKTKNDSATIEDVISESLRKQSPKTFLER